MKKITFCLLSALILSGCLSSGQGAQSVRKHGAFHGTYIFPIGMISMEIVSLEPRVIRNQEDFLRFKQGIPPFEMTRTSPAPVNEDPLISIETIDWGSKMMVVIFSHDPDRFINLIISDVGVKDRIMTVTARYRSPEEEEIVQKIPEFGLYYALIVDRFDGQVLFGKVIDNARDSTSES